MNVATPPDLAPRAPTLAEATRVWAKIGLLSFGGPAGQIALMHKELVEERRWIAESRFLHALNFCMLLPGPEAQQLATYVGWLLHGTRGGIIAGTLFVIPGFVVISVLSALYALFHEAGWLASLFFGLKAAVLAIVIEAVVRVGRRALKNGVMVGIAILAFVALFAFSVPFPVVVLLAALIGLIGTGINPALFSPPKHKAAAPDLPSVIGENFTKPHPSLASTLRTAAVWVALWIAPLLVIVPALGWSSTFGTLWVFFSQMATVTFGGAYAVLAYVAQEAVQNFGWLRPGEMVDGLALAETTPGPLVMVLSFVGFLAAYRDPGGLDPLLAGLLGSALTTWVTFVPCFLWIFLGGPYIEKLRSNRELSGALSAITAAVVGVILNLAIWFGLHVLFREVGTFTAGPVSVATPNLMTVNLAAVALSIVAGVCLFRLKVGITWTLAVCGGMGLAVMLVPLPA
ncbi:chromate efflux transporter [Devosia sp. ZB163]|uniref:chromate efflux transporter n=1 Tax=Devosia sp. ZB163 TaxID=3025938 RepID=UPI00235E906A|nr:chromate efflux transporter [Devosia sp. ZB163]MDC9822766.1 chromate efflux transporter [Devosia sp. ZB163]